MAMKKRVPEIRFQGFSGEWEEKKLGEIGMTQSGIGFPDCEQGGKSGTPFFKVSDMNNDGNEHEMHFANHYVSKEQASRRNWVPITNVPALIIAKVGAALLLNRKRLVNASFLIDNNLMAYIFNTSWDVRFGKACFETINLPLYAQTGALPSYNGKDIEAIRVNLPSDIPEQSKIGSFFQSLDAQITLHQRKLSKLGAVKKSMLEKMFPREGAAVPEIRFQGFTGKWERKTLGEIVTEIRRPIELKDEVTYELVTVKRRNEGVVSRGELKGKQILTKNYFELRAGDYIISKRQIVHGANGIVPPHLDRAIVSNEYLVAIGNDQITAEYFALFSKRPEMYKMFFLSSYGIDIEKLVFDVDDWKKRFVVIPELPEQQKIGAFFTQLDSLINLQQRELDKLKNIKQACLAKMFV